MKRLLCAILLASNLVSSSALATDYCEENYNIGGYCVPRECLVALGIIASVGVQQLLSRVCMRNRAAAKNLDVQEPVYLPDTLEPYENVRVYGGRPVFFLSLSEYYKRFPTVPASTKSVVDVPTAAATAATATKLEVRNLAIEYTGQLPDLLHAVLEGGKKAIQRRVINSYMINPIVAEFLTIVGYQANGSPDEFISFIQRSAKRME